MMEVITSEDVYDKCALCQKQQNAVSNLNEKPFYINSIPTCRHKFCDSCIQRELNRKRSFLCPICGTAVSQDKLSTKTFEEIEVEKDVAMRRKIKALFNKTEDDFMSRDDFLDYEEKVEDIIYNLVHEIDIEKTKAEIELYEKENRDLAARNQMKLIQKLKEEEIRIREEDSEKALKNSEYLNQIKKELVEKKQHQQQQNSRLLGDADAQSAPSAAQSSMVLGGKGGNTPAPPTMETNPVIMFLNQRPEPKVLVEGVTESKKRKELGDNQNLRLMHTAGGYDHAQQNRRNWIEIHSQLVRDMME